MDFSLSEELTMLRDMARKFTDQEIKPQADAIDRDGDIPESLIKQMAELGFFGICFPEEYGGVGAGELGYCIVSEEVSRGSASITVLLGAHASIGAMSIYLDGTEEQRKKYLTPLSTGENIAAFALTEPNAGSDAAAIETTAVKDGNEFVINGRKIYISNGSIADTIIVFAVTDKALGAHGGVTAFIVEANLPGYKVVRDEDKMGIRGSHTSELLFEEMRVPAENVLGRYGAGFLTAMKALDRGRLGLGAGCLGAAKEVLDMSAQHAKERKQFGKSIADNQAIQWMLSDMCSDIYAMESIVYRTAWMCDQGMKFSRQSAIVKTFCSEKADEIIHKAIQIHGGIGYMKDFPLERMYRDSRINLIFEGTNEIQRMIIARDILKKGGY
ncbi:acyl-CoA dehydrogenase [candidate division KSB1 bacterium]|nr:acyl-CoA dehydrogenase [candidate division KSB1 bacterium]